VLFAPVTPGPVSDATKPVRPFPMSGVDGAKSSVKALNRTPGAAPGACAPARATSASGPDPWDQIPEWLACVAAGPIRSAKNVTRPWASIRGVGSGWV
jgi:hypothetical protein